MLGSQRVLKAHQGLLEEGLGLRLLAGRLSELGQGEQVSDGKVPLGSQQPLMEHQRTLQEGLGLCVLALQGIEPSQRTEVGSAIGTLGSPPCSAIDRACCSRGSAWAYLPCSR